jgi:hypothetical protein
MSSQKKTLRPTREDARQALKKDGWSDDDISRVIPLDEFEIQTQLFMRRKDEEADRPVPFLGNDVTAIHREISRNL